ncbi:hypothetical protein [Arthrobacter sp. UYCu723]
MTTQFTNTQSRPAGVRNPFIVHRLDAHIAEALTTGKPVPLNAARLLAACYHHGIDSALCTFAATGRLDAQTAAKELLKTSSSSRGESGCQALIDYVNARIEATTATAKGATTHGTLTNPR